MAQQTISDEELQLRKRARRRLVGAVALVMLVVIFLPMVLDKEPKPVGQDIAIHIPSQEDTNFKPSMPASGPASTTPTIQKPAEVPAPVDAAAAKASEPAKTEQPANQPARLHAEAKPAAVPAKEPAQKPVTVAEEKAKPATEAKPLASAKSHGYVLLLGAFANMDNAKQRQAKLSELGIRFYTEKMKSPSGEKLRVRAGPYATRDEAEKVLNRLKAQGIKDGLVAEKN